VREYHSPPHRSHDPTDHCIEILSVPPALTAHRHALNSSRDRPDTGRTNCIPRKRPFSASLLTTASPGHQARRRSRLVSSAISDASSKRLFHQLFWLGLVNRLLNFADIVHDRVKIGLVAKVHLAHLLVVSAQSFLDLSARCQAQSAFPRELIMRTGFPEETRL